MNELDILLDDIGEITNAIMDLDCTARLPMVRKVQEIRTDFDVAYDWSAQTFYIREKNCANVYFGNFLSRSSGVVTTDPSITPSGYLEMPPNSYLGVPPDYNSNPVYKL